MTVWVLHQPLTPQEEANIEQRTHLTLPFDNLPDLSRVTSEATCHHLLSKLHPELPPESITGMLDRVWKQYRLLHLEDILAVPLPASKSVALAHVTGPYEYSVGPEGSDIHRIPVGWYKRLSPRLTTKHANVFSVRSGAMLEIENREVRIAILDQLPHSYNRFVKWKWLLVVFFGLGMLRMIEEMIRH